ncbi:MAG: DUF167 domain-containing protein [Chloroflexi bacterium]|nr:DUF167 domain-containing protein [Chloroflexota bacterium]
MRVTAPPESGKANAAVIALLARQLRIPKRSAHSRAGASLLLLDQHALFSKRPLARGRKSRDNIPRFASE